MHHFGKRHLSVTLRKQAAHLLVVLTALSLVTMVALLFQSGHTTNSSDQQTMTLNRRTEILRNHEGSDQTPWLDIPSRSNTLEKSMNRSGVDLDRNIPKGKSSSGEQTALSHSLYVSPIGHLGNQMFVYASAYALAHNTNYCLVASPHFELWNMFDELTAESADVPDGVAIKTIHEDKPGRYSESLESLPATDIRLCCFLQSWKYFHAHKGSLRKEFSFKRSVISSATALFQKYVHLQPVSSMGYHHGNQSQRTMTYIGVHVRIGDLNSTEHLKRGYKVAPLGYILRAMEYYRTKYKQVLFLVFSDFSDKDWCRTNLAPNRPDVVLTGYNPPEFDLAMLSLCNHTVVTVGTFSWWASWLAGGDVVYYADWPTPHTEIGQAYNTSEYFPANWIPMT